VVPTTIIDSPKPSIQLPNLNLNLKGKIKSKLNLKTKVDKQLDKMSSDVGVKQLGYDLYLRSISITNVGDSLKLNTCVWIATKLILRTLIPKHELKFPFHEILQTERLICHHLNFRLHSTGSDCLVVA
jgi:hypothetical protein